MEIYYNRNVINIYYQMNPLTILSGMSQDCIWVSTFILSNAAGNLQIMVK